MCLHGDQSGTVREYAQDTHVYHLVNATTSLARSFDREGGSRNPVKDVTTVGFGPERPRMNVYCKEAPGSVILTGPAAEVEGDINSLPETEDDFGQNPLSGNKGHTSLNSRTDTGNVEIALAS